jgi:prophage regulatory protein
VQRTIRRTVLRQLVPLSDTTIYEMEQRGEFPRRFNLSPRCVVWDLAEVEAWVASRKADAEAGTNVKAPSPDVRQRRWRSVPRPMDQTPSTARMYRGVELQPPVKPPTIPRSALEGAVKYAIEKNRHLLSREGKS